MFFEHGCLGLFTAMIASDVRTIQVLCIIMEAHVNAPQPTVTVVLHENNGIAIV